MNSVRNIVSIVWLLMQEIEKSELDGGSSITRRVSRQPVTGSR